MNLSLHAGHVAVKSICPLGVNRVTNPMLFLPYSGHENSNLLLFWHLLAMPLLSLQQRGEAVNTRNIQSPSDTQWGLFY